MFTRAKERGVRWKTWVLFSGWWMGDGGLEGIYLGSDDVRTEADCGAEGLGAWHICRVF